MRFIDKIKEQAKQNKKRIVLPETMDERVLKAAEIIIKDDLADIILIGDEEELTKNDILKFWNWQFFIFWGVHLFKEFLKN